MVMFEGDWLGTVRVTHAFLPLRDAPTQESSIRRRKNSRKYDRREVCERIPAHADQRAGFFGVGGGFAIVSALVLAPDYEMPVAVGTSLLVIAVSSADGHPR
jgi:hypothetical protein